jgi:opacity protein-like surface antigen
MRKTVIAFAALATFPGAAAAADMALKAPPAPVYDWSGFYLGGVAGYGWGPQDISNRLNLVSGTVSPPYSVQAHGWLGGARGGYNLMLRPEFLAGVEADFSAVDVAAPHVIPGSVPGINVSTANNKIESLGTARGRLGWTSNNTLIYGTAGVAWFTLDHTRVQVVGTSNNAAPGTLDTMSATTTGWTAGAGVEFGFAPHWSINAEYLFLSSFEPIQLTNAFAENNAQIGLRLNIVRSGINYRF